LDRGEIHPAIGTVEDLGERFATVPLVQDSFIMVMRQDHPALAGRLMPHVMAALPYLEISSSAEPSGFVDDWFAGHGLTRNIAHRAPRLSAAAILSRTDLVAVLD
jgi:DNA-binding transcriptional LysR family regulator